MLGLSKDLLNFAGSVVIFIQYIMSVYSNLHNEFGLGHCSRKSYSKQCKKIWKPQGS